MPILNDEKLVAACGLYCGSCRKYQKGKCPGCSKNEKATWCQVKSCCQEKSIQSCAGCEQDAGGCKKLNNPISKFFAIVFRSDRLAALRAIKEKGYPQYAAEMAEKGQMTVKK